jgi:microcystin-dependent protein
MADTPTTSLRLRKQQVNANNNAWGGYLNDDVIGLLDEAIAGFAAITVSGNVTLTSVNYDTDQSRKAVIFLTGAGGFTVTIPQVSKVYVIQNACPAAVTITTGGGGANVVIPANSLALIWTNGDSIWRVAGSADREVGEIVDFAGAAAPSGWLLCFGQAVSRTTYAALFGVIGTTYGAGNGTTTFNLPDLRGRVTAGQDDMGGTSANRLTGASGGVDGDVLGATGGDETHVLTTAQLASHSHTAVDPGHTHGRTDPGHSHSSNDHNHRWYDFGGGGSQTIDGTNTSGGAVSFNAAAAALAIGDPLIVDYYTEGKNSLGGAVADVIANTTGITINSATTGVSIASNGSGAAHNNVQPTAILNKMIFTGV